MCSLSNKFLTLIYRQPFQFTKIQKINLTAISPSTVEITDNEGGVGSSGGKGGSGTGMGKTLGTINLTIFKPLLKKHINN